MATDTALTTAAGNSGDPSPAGGERPPLSVCAVPDTRVSHLHVEGLSVFSLYCFCPGMLLGDCVGWLVQGVCCSRFCCSGAMGGGRGGGEEGTRAEGLPDSSKGGQNREPAKHSTGLSFHSPCGVDAPLPSPSPPSPLLPPPPPSPSPLSPSLTPDRKAGHMAPQRRLFCNSHA